MTVCCRWILLCPEKQQPRFPEEPEEQLLHLRTMNSVLGLQMSGSRRVHRNPRAVPDLLLGSP